MDTDMYVEVLNCPGIREDRLLILFACYALKKTSPKTYSFVSSLCDVTKGTDTFEVAVAAHPAKPCKAETVKH